MSKEPPQVQEGQEVLYIPAASTAWSLGSDPIPAEVIVVNPDGSIDVVLLPDKYDRMPRFYATYSESLVPDQDYSHWHESPQI